MPLSKGELPSPLTFKILFITILLSSSGVLIGTAYSIHAVSPTLIDQGIHVLNEAKSFIVNVMQAVDVPLTSVKSVRQVLEEVDLIIEDNVDAEGIVSDLQCMKPWLATVPDPSSIQEDVMEVLSITADRVLPPIRVLAYGLASFERKLQRSQLLDRIANLLNSKDTLLSLIMKARNFESIAVTLPVIGGTQHMPGVITAFQEFYGNPPWEDKVQSLTDIVITLQQLKAALTPLDDVQLAVDALEDVLPALEIILDTLSTTLLPDAADDILDTYKLIQPCLSLLISKASYIDEYIVGLPKDLKEQIEYLAKIQQLIDDIISGPLVTVKEFIDLPGDSAIATTLLEEAQKALHESGPEIVDAAQQALDLLQSLEGLISMVQGIRNVLRDSEGSLFALNVIYLNQGCSVNPAVYTSCLNKTLELSDAIALWLHDMPDIEGIFSSAETALSYAEQLPVLVNALNSIAGVQLPSNSEVATVLSELDSSLPQPIEGVIDDAIRTVNSMTSDINDTLGGIENTIDTVIRGAPDMTQLQTTVMSTINSIQGEYEPIIRLIDKVRQVVSYTLLIALLVLAIVCAATASCCWPAGIIAGLVFFLLLLTMSSLVAVLFTAILKVGKDGCDGLERLILNAWDIGSEAEALANYYFYGAGGDLKTVLNTTLNLNLDSILDEISMARDTFALEVAFAYQLGPVTQDKFDQAIAHAQDIEFELLHLLQVLSYEQVFPAYAELKSFPCCAVLDSIGKIWTGLIITCIFGIILALASTVLLRAFDRISARPDYCMKFIWKDTKKICK